MSRTSFSRLKVVVPGFTIGAILSGLFAMRMGSHLGWGLGDFCFIWLSVLAGPFAGHWAAAGWGIGDTLAWGIPSGLAIAFHPLSPNWFSGMISGIGIFFWILIGFATTYYGV